MRYMSFFLTKPQILDKTKTQTRRFGWNFLKAGDYIQAVTKIQGLKKGQKIEKLAKIYITNIYTEPLNKMKRADCAKEGFPDLTPDDFIDMVVNRYNCKRNKAVNVIDFVYVDDAGALL